MLKLLAALICYNPIMGTASRYILFGQLSLFGFLLVCTVLMPHFLFEANEGGVSNYGVHVRTIMPYSLAFGLSGIFTVRAAWMLPETIRSYAQLRLALVLLGVLYVCTLASTYSYQINNVYGDVHQLSGTLLLIVELLFGGWIVLRLDRDSSNLSLFALQCLGILLAALTYGGVIHILFIAEILPALAFGVLLIRSVVQLEQVAARTDHGLSP